MEEIKTLLEARENYLLKLKIEKENMLKHAPEGSLRINKKGDRTQYYHRNNPKDVTGTYIRRDNLIFANQLAQKDYDEKIIKSAEKELEAIRKYIANYPENNVEQIFASIHKERQRLVNPIQEPIEEMIQKWEKVQYEGKEFPPDYPEIYTDRDERVRSKSEALIANLLYKEGIPYRYEYPLRFKGYGFIYPDFLTLNTRTRKEIIFEHFGLMEDEGYEDTVIKKLNSYIQNGYYPGDNLIFTMETHNNPLNVRVVKQMIEHYLK